MAHPAVADVFRPRGLLLSQNFRMVGRVGAWLALVVGFDVGPVAPIDVEATGVEVREEAEVRAIPVEEQHLVVGRIEPGE